jgi:acetyl-CoA carboxylase biotin carboxyl carrier protein
VENKQIKELMAAMERCGMTKLHLKKGTFELSLERSPGEALAATLEEGLEGQERPKLSGSLRRGNAPLPAFGDMASALHPSEQPVKNESPGTFITSPMVGTYYSAPSPDDPPFLKVGHLVEKGDIVCIIEAMKVMNEIKAQVSGTVLEILVDNGHPVEFGTKLVRIQA